jgi:hypothetical protein
VARRSCGFKESGLDIAAQASHCGDAYPPAAADAGSNSTIISPRGLFSFTIGPQWASGHLIAAAMALSGAWRVFS